MMSVNKFFLTAMFITACSTSNISYDIDVPKAPAVKMRDVTWEVINVESDNDIKSYMCLDPHSYSNMSMNVQDLKLYMIYQNKILKLKERK